MATQADITFSFASLGDDRRLRACLRDYGVALVTGVLSPAKCASAVPSLRDFAMRHHVGEEGIVMGHGAAHVEAVWLFRLNPQVRDVYALAYDVPEEQ